MACRDGTPGILSDAELLQQQSLLGSAYASLVVAEQYVESGLHLIVLSSDADVEAALLQPYVRSLEAIDPLRTSETLRSAVEALEQHIVNMSDLSFNDYLLTRGLQVSEDFATLSETLGHPIDAGNIA
jgi:hypothetical protein